MENRGDNTKEIIEMFEMFLKDFRQTARSIVWADKKARENRLFPVVYEPADHLTKRSYNFINSMLRLSNGSESFNSVFCDCLEIAKKIVKRTV